MCPMVVLDVIRLCLTCGAHTQEARLAALSHLELVQIFCVSQTCQSFSFNSIFLARSVVYIGPQSLSLYIFGSNPAATLGNMDLFLDSLARILGNTVYCAFF